MIGWHRLILFNLLVIFAVFGLSILWEFEIEAWFSGEFEDTAEHWEYVITSTAFCCIALIIPTWLLARETKRRRAIQERMFHTQKMEAIGRLAGGVAHDIDKVLGLIQGRSSDLNQMLEGSKEARRALTDIDIAAKQGRDLVLNLLGFAGTDSSAVARIRIDHLIHAVIDYLGPTLPPQIGLQRDLDVADIQMLGDEMQLTQAIVHVCINAIEAMPNGGQLKLSSAIHYVISDDADPALTRGQYLALRITDNGHGIPDDVRRRATEPFYTTKDPDKGSGLGLTVAEAAARSHGGKLSIRSKPGHGTTVTFLLPCFDLDTHEDDRQTVSSQERSAADS